jgi:hypothetical protein
LYWATDSDYVNKRESQKEHNKIPMILPITSLLLMGTNIVTIQSYAGGGDLQHKNVVYLKNSVKKDAISVKANQHLSQDNSCYGNENCKQASECHQIVGKDNEAACFNDQSKTIPKSITPTPPQSPTPTPKTCVDCFTTVFAGLTFRTDGYCSSCIGWDRHRHPITLRH